MASCGARSSASHADAWRGGLGAAGGEGREPHATRARAPSGFIGLDEGKGCETASETATPNEGESKTDHTKEEEEMRGMLYQRGKIWWIKCYAAGRPVRESTGTTKKSEAARILAQKVGRAAAGEPVLPRADRICYEEVREDLVRYYATTGSRGLDEAGYRLTHLDGYFAGRRIVTIGQADATRYAELRQREGASNATVNRELAVLGRMLRIAAENNKLLRLPILRKLKENGPRQGFFEREQFLAVRRRLSPDLQLAVTIAHSYGWRMQSEVLSLERRQLDLEVGTLRLEPGTTKNDDGRVVYLTPELKVLLAAQLERIRAVERKTGRIIPHLFPFLTGRRRCGARRTDFRKAWETARKAAGVPGALRHDLRRTAVRNLERSGVPRSVAMRITGHKTESVYRRYSIVCDADLRDAATKIAAVAEARG